MLRRERHPRSRCRFAALWAPLLAGLLLVGVGCAKPDKRQFDIPAGKGAQTLKEFARQAEVQILYTSPEVGEVKTQAVSGHMTPTDALDAMLAGTHLLFEREAGTGAYAVITRRGPAPAQPH